VHDTDHAVGFLSNLMRHRTNKEDKGYLVMPVGGDAKYQQVHVEQIAMYQLLALLQFLGNVKGGNNKPLFVADNLSASAEVYFDGLDKHGKPLTSACPGCEGVMKEVKKQDKRIKEISLLQNC
jgi:hypothetical protein